MASILVADQAQSGCAENEYTRNQLLNNVVIINTVKPGKGEEFGLGFIIGRRNDTVWVATAAHVINAVRDDPDGWKGITVRRRNDPRPWFLDQPPRFEVTAGEMSTNGEDSRELDLAFLPVGMPLLDIGIDVWRESIIAASPQPGEQVWVAGRPGWIDYDPNTVRVGVPEADGIPTVDGLTGQLGQSGALLTLSRGIIGMLTQSMGLRMVPIDVIQRAASLERLPWALNISPIPPPIEVQICFQFEGTHHPRLAINGPCGVVEIGANGCTTAIAAHYRPIAKEPYVICSPNEFELNTTPRQNVSLTCNIDPSGLWVSTSLGFLNVTPHGRQIWKVSGLELAMSDGYRFYGELKGQPPVLALSAKNAAGSYAQGMLRLEPTTLQGKVTLNGSTIDVNFTR